MIKNLSISFLLCVLGSSALHAQQWTKQDSLKLRRLLESEGEIFLNPDAVNSIRFESSPLGDPMIATESPALKYNEELPGLPAEKKDLRKILTLRPYSVFTKRGEDPIMDRIKDEQLKRDLAMKLNLARIRDNLKIGNVTVKGVVGRDPNAPRPEKGFNYAGASVGGLDLMAPFTKKFWKRRVKATAWKTY